MNRSVRCTLLVWLIVLGCLLSGCQSENTGEDETMGPIEEPTIVFSSREVKETEGDLVIYRAQINEPILLLPPTADSNAKEAIGQALTELCDTLLACPVDLEGLRSKSLSSPQTYRTYERLINAQVTWIDSHFFSLLFSIETIGGGISSDLSMVGFTMSTHAAYRYPLFPLVGLDEEEGRELYIKAFEEDMQKNPMAYDDPQAGVKAEWVDQTLVCLTQNGVMIWMPDNTVSLGASPILELSEADLIRLVGKGRMLHLTTPEQDLPYPEEQTEKP